MSETIPPWAPPTVDHFSGCVACDSWSMIVHITADERDEARRKVEETQRLLDLARAELTRLRAELRDEQRENGALRRRLAVGGR